MTDHVHAPFYYRRGLKITFAVLFCLSALLSILGGVAVYYIGEAGMYTQPEEQVKHELYDRIGRQTAHRMMYGLYEYYTFSTVEQLYAMEGSMTDEQLTEALDENNVFLCLTDGEGKVIVSTPLPDDVAYENEAELHLTFGEAGEIEVHRLMHFYIPQTLQEGGTIWRIDRHLSQVYAARFWVAAVFSMALLGSLALFVLLMCGAGRHIGESEPRPSFFERLPTDAMLALYAVLALLVGVLYTETYFSPHALTVFLCVLVTLPCLPLGLLLFMSLATRIKCRTLFRNTLIFRLLCVIWRYLLRPVVRILSKIPTVWKTALLLASISLIEFIVLLIFSRSFWLFALWLLETVLLSLLVLYIALSMKRLQQGSRALAEGDLTYQLDEGGLMGDFRRHAQDLNRISEGMSRAVDERLQSERFRTELITNVSHDIKTPLTSIISYINLLKTAPADSAEARQYMETIDRQSIRLKKLMEDLIDVSKATTGNVTIQSAPCELAVLLSQALGEYQERMRAAELLPVLHIAEPAPIIMADGRLLWRVFDNLLSNVLKYAMAGTRVYLDLAVEGDAAKLVFRNISKQELNVKPSELLERFVRGDRSRHTEGSGLGLSIAQSLTERMGGTLALAVDGDLFKVILTFPQVKQENI